MLRYVVGRIFQGAFVILGVTTIAFVLIRATGDPTLLILGDLATPASRQDLRIRMGWDRPVYAQFVQYVRGVARGDLGRSLYDGRPAIAVYAERIPASLELASVAMVLAFGLSLPIAVGSVVSRNVLVRGLTETILSFGQAVPTYWLGLLLILVFSVTLGWFPSGGRETANAILLPAVTLATWTAARVVRVTRAKLLEIIPQDYVRTAWAKGLSVWRVYYHHVVPNAAIIIVTLATAEFVTMFSAAVMTETVFAWPGVGALLAESVYRRDYPTVQAGLLVISALVVAVNIATDLLYLVLDPRIRIG